MCGVALTSLLYLQVDDDHFVFHLDMFKKGTTKEANHLDKHKSLIDAGYPEMVRHPIMTLFTSLKWYPHKKWYYTKFVIFLMFIISLTFHMVYFVDYLQCECENVQLNKTKPHCKQITLNNETVKSCREGLEPMFTITKYSSWGILVILTGIEILQFIMKLVTKELWEYFSKQNICEVLMISFGQAFFVVQYNDLKMGTQSLTERDQLKCHLFGWTLFLAWIDLTIFLGRFDIFGKHIYRSWYVMKNVAWSLMVYIPIIVAFACAFHVFLIYNEIFQGPVASMLKVLTMILGEFDFEGNFVYDKVDEINGSNWSVQILLILFIFYGSFIIMNLITAWIVINQRDANETEVILAKQRIEEISGVTRFTAILSICFRMGSNNDLPSKLCISPIDESEAVGWCKQLWFDLKSWLDDDSFGKLCMIKKHCDLENGTCKKLSRNVPSHTRAVGPTIKMLGEKKAKQLSLIKTIKEIHQNTEKDLKTLLLEGKQIEPKTYRTSSEQIPEGCTLQYIAFKTPNGTLQMKHC